MKKIKILMILENLNKCDGIATFAMNYYKYINKEKFQIDFVLTSNEICNDYQQIINDNDSHIYTVLFHKDKSLMFNINLIKKFMKEHASKYNIVHSNLINKGYYYFKYAKKYGIDIRILHSHTMILGSNHPLKKIRNEIFKKLAINSANVYLACTNAAGKFLFNNKKFTIIHNAIDVEKFQYNRNIRNEYRNDFNLSNQFVIGCVGRITYGKNHEFLIDIFKSIINKYPNSILLLVGNGDLEEKIKLKVSELNISKNVKFLGSRDDVNNLYQSMDLFLFPSLFEGLGMVLIEAQTAGLPCIASSTIPKEANINNLVKYVSLDKNADEWANECLKYINYRRKNYLTETIESGYSLNLEVKSLEELYINLIENKINL